MYGSSLSSVPWSIRPLTTHDIFKVRFLAASHMVRKDVSPVFSITWLRKRSLCPPLAFFPWTLPARMRSSSSPFRMMWPVKRVCLSLMVLGSWHSCPIREAPRCWFHVLYTRHGASDDRTTFLWPRCSWPTLLRESTTHNHTKVLTR